MEDRDGISQNVSQNAAKITNGPIPEKTLSPLAEQWPYLRFLGLGAWWAWIWLSFMSPSVVSRYPEQFQLSSILAMYLISTASIAGVMVIASILWRPFTRLIDNSKAVTTAAFIAALATWVLAANPGVGGTSIFTLCAVLTGLGTGALCLKVGRIYGTVNLSDSLTAGALSLIFAVFLYFVGTGVPSMLTPYYIALLPLISAALLCMSVRDTLAEQDNEVAERAVFFTLNTREGKLWLRLMVAAAIVAMTAGVGKGVSSLRLSVEAFSLDGVLSVLAIGTIGVIIVVVTNRWPQERRGARIVYTALMVMGVAIMLATGFGFPIGFLSIGKECLWFMFSCLMAYMAFRFGVANVRAFAMGQAVYFVGSAAGWAIGAAIAPYYGAGNVAMVVGVIMAFAVVIVMTYGFPERDIRDIRSLSCEVLWKSSKLELTALSEGAVLNSSEVDRTHSIQCEEPSEARLCRINSQIAQDETGYGFEEISKASNSCAAEASLTSQALPNTTFDPHPQHQLAALLEQRFGLSAREFEIMELFAQGRSANWIAETLVISKNTVRSHLRAIYAKLDIHTRQELLDLLAQLCEK